MSTFIIGGKALPLDEIFERLCAAAGGDVKAAALEALKEAEKARAALAAAEQRADEAAQEALSALTQRDAATFTLSQQEQCYQAFLHRHTALSYIRQHARDLHDAAMAHACTALRSEAPTYEDYIAALESQRDALLEQQVMTRARINDAESTAAHHARAVALLRDALTEMRRTAEAVLLVTQPDPEPVLASYAPDELPALLQNA